MRLQQKNTQATLDLWNAQNQQKISLDDLTGATGITQTTITSTGAGLQTFIDNLSSASSAILSFQSSTAQASAAVITTIGRMPSSMLGYSASLPGYATGLDEVPYDMPVKVHKGERIIPASENRSGSDKKLQMQNIFNIQSNDPSLPWKVSKTVTDQVKFNLLRIT